MKQAELDRAKEVLTKLDPELVNLAIGLASVDLEEVDQIKEHLQKYSFEAVRYAVAEMEQVELKKEFVAIREALAEFPAKVLQDAAADLGIVGGKFLCYNGIDCKGACVQVMGPECQTSMYTRIDPRALVASLGADRAIREARVLEEV